MTSMESRSGTASGPLTRAGNERGAALIIVLIMLLLLIILGTTLFTSSVTEIRVAGNYRNNMETFFAADAAVEFAMTNSVIYTSLYGNTKTWTNEITIPGTTDKARVKVELVKSKGNPPPGYGFQEDAGIGGGGGFKSNQFAVTVTANGPNNARTDLEAGVARIVPQ